MATPTFKVTKTLITGYCERGLTVKDMADEITKASGEACSPAVVTKAARTFGIDLRKKNRSSAFEFVDDTTEETEPVMARTLEAELA